jgi:hypothetical protein
MSVESLLTRELDIRFIDARFIVTEAKLLTWECKDIPTQTSGKTYTEKLSESLRRNVPPEFGAHCGV